jgi:hypothetical protein
VKRASIDWCVDIAREGRVVKRASIDWRVDIAREGRV